MSNCSNFTGITTSTAANFFAPVIIDIFNYSSTVKNKTFKALSSSDVSGSYGGIVGLVQYGVGLYAPPSITGITTITLTPAVGSNFTAYTSLALYGIK